MESEEVYCGLLSSLQSEFLVVDLFLFHFFAYKGGGWLDGKGVWSYDFNELKEQQ